MNWKQLIVLMVAGGIAAAGSTRAIELKSSVIEIELQKIKYQAAFWTVSAESENLFAAFDDTEFGDEEKSRSRNRLDLKRKSPLKAFLFSLALPGLGQWYNGSRLKPFAFLGAEAAVWGLYSKWHSQGKDRTAEFEAFNRTHWSRDSYENKYLQWTYGVNDDDSLSGPTYFEISHHLPDDSNDQQYYEMTGKYIQFSWGWDDATLNDSTINDYGPGNAPPRILGQPGDTPFSAKRLLYEDMRKDANDSFDRANKMIIASMLNRLTSAFEAYFSARSLNNRISDSFGDFGQIKMRPTIKSYHSSLDTPYIKLTYQF